MSSASQTASKEGFNFEEKLFTTLTKYLNGFTIRQEKDIKKEYGEDTSGIDMEIFKPLTTKQIFNKEEYKHIFIQLKWKDKAESIKDINHFICGCTQIIKQKSLDDKSVLHIYGTKVPISKPSMEALMKLYMSENITFNDMETCVLAITNKCLEFFNKRKINVKNEIEINKIYDDNFNYEELKKCVLIDLVMKRYGYKKTNASKLRHNELVQILTNNKQKIETFEEMIINESDKTIPINIYLLVEYDEPTKRNVGEFKSKLLKPGSELFNFLTKLKTNLRSKGFHHQDRMGLHTEVLNSSDESLEVFLDRVKVLEGKKIDIKDHNNYDIVGRAICIMLGDLEGYNKDAKITIAYLPDVNLNDVLKVIYEYIDSI